MSLSKIYAHPFSIALQYLVVIFILPLSLSIAFATGEKRLMIALFGMIIAACLFIGIFNIFYFYLFGVSIEKSCKKKVLIWFVLGLILISYAGLFIFQGVDRFLFFFMEGFSLLIVVIDIFNRTDIDISTISRFFGLELFNYKKVLSSIRAGFLDSPIIAGGIGCIGFASLSYGKNETINKKWNDLYKTLPLQGKKYVVKSYGNGMSVGWRTEDEVSQGMCFFESRGKIKQDLTVVSVSASDYKDPQYFTVKAKSGKQPLTLTAHSFKKTNPFKEGKKITLNLVAQGEYAYIHPKNFKEEKPKPWQIEKVRFKDFPETFLIDENSPFTWLRGKITEIKKAENNFTKESIFIIQLKIQDFSIEAFINEISLLGTPEINNFVEGSFLMSGNI